MVGSKKMVTFDDTLPVHKVTLHDKGFRRTNEMGTEWITMHQGKIAIPKVDAAEPLQCEANHFIECIRNQ